MKDLKIKYKDKEGKVVNEEYDTIMDFIDRMESSDPDIPNPDFKVTEYKFFDNPLNAGANTTIGALLERCKQIIK